MPIYPQIKEQKYHEMSWQEIDGIREKINSGEIGLVVNNLKSMAHLNQMARKYSLVLKWVQNVSILCFIGVLASLFINWRFSLSLFLIGVVTSIFYTKKAPEYIFRNCKEDRVFLKYALSTGLVEIKEESEQDH